MNNTFSSKRFTNLCKKHFSEHLYLYLLSAGVLFGIILLLLEFIAFTNSGNFKITYQADAFIVVFFLAGSIFTSLSFSALGNKRQAVSALMLPASHFEKYLLQWIYSFLLFQLVYIGVFYAADAIVVALNLHGKWRNISYENSLFNLLDTSNDAHFAFIFYFLFHSLSFWGSVFFEKFHFIKTAFLFFVSVMVLSVAGQAFLSKLTGLKLAYNALPFGNISFMEKGNVIIHIEPPVSMITSGLFVLAVVVLLFWASAYFRLKEKQI